jgi:hypothetical protein
VVGIELIRTMEEKMLKIKQNLKASQDRNKIYVDKGITHKEFKVGHHLFSKVNANKSSLKLGNCSKLVARYCGPFEILERIRHVACILAFLESISIHNVFHVLFLKTYIPDANHVINWNLIQVEKEDTFKVHLVCILDQKIMNLWNQAMGLVKV